MSIISSFTARILASFSSIFFKKMALRTPNLNGSWVYEQITHSTDYNPYKGMTLRYIALLKVVDGRVSGTAEKFWEQLESGETKEYVGTNRTLANFEGHIEKKAFKKAKVILQITEFGELRNYSTQHRLFIEEGNVLNGSFDSTAANQSGKCRWVRKTS